MFGNLGWPEIVVIVLIGLFVFGPERFPKLLADLGKGVRKLRKMARDATADISREVGTDIDITDLHPKTFIRKHVLSEADEETLRNPLKSALNDISSEAKGVTKEINNTSSSLTSRPKQRNNRPAEPDSIEDGEAPAEAEQSSEAKRRRFDEAT